MSTLTFVINDASTGGNNPQVQVTITENANGTLSFNIVQLVSAQGGYVGDLRGFFFDISNESLLNSLTISGPSSIGTLQKGNDSVVDLGNGATMSGLTNADGLKASKTAGAEQNGFDAGFEIGSAGLGKDDVQELTFTLSSDMGALSLKDFANVDFGVRLTSVGPVDAAGNFIGPREGSSKIAERSFIPQLDAKDATADATLEDSTATGNLFAAGLTGTGTMKEVLCFTLDGTTYHFSSDVPSHTVELMGTEGATITVYVDGTYVINAANADELSLNEEISASLSYTVRETYYEANGTIAGSVTDSATFNLSVKGVNDAPEAADDSYAAVSSDVANAAFATVLTNDEDIDRNDVLSVSAVNGAALSETGMVTITLESGGKITMNADGTFSYDATGLTTRLYEGQHIDETFTYMVSDGQGGFDTGTVSFRVDGIGHPVVTDPKSDAPDAPPVSTPSNDFPNTKTAPEWVGDKNFGPDISHFTLYFEPNLGGDTAPKPAGDGLYTVKIDTPENFPDDLDGVLSQILAVLRNDDPNKDGNTSDDLYPFINGDTTLLGVAIKGSTLEKYYAFDGNTNGPAPDVLPSGDLVTKSEVDLALKAEYINNQWLLA